MELVAQLRSMLEEAASEQGRQLEVDLDEVASYAAERAGYLSTLIGQPGFDRALIAERDNVALRAAIQATSAADAVDNRLIGVVQGGLRIAAAALASSL